MTAATGLPTTTGVEAAVERLRRWKDEVALWAAGGAGEPADPDDCALLGTGWGLAEDLVREYDRQRMGADR